MKASLLLLPLLALAWAGCASQGAATADSPYPPTRPEDVVVYASVEDVPGEYDFLGFLSPPQTSSYGNSEARAEASARREAAARGANAIVRVDADSPIAEERIRQGLARGTSANRSGLAALYVYPATTPAPDGAP